MEWKADPAGGRPQMVKVPGSTEVPLQPHVLATTSLQLTCTAAVMLEHPSQRFETPRKSLRRVNSGFGLTEQTGVLWVVLPFCLA